MAEKTFKSIDEDFEEDLPDLISNMHICDDEGFGCEIEEFTAHGGKNYCRCKLRRESLETIVAAHQAEMDRVVDEVIGDNQPELNGKDFTRASLSEQKKDITASRCNLMRNEQRARYKAIKEKR